MSARARFHGSYKKKTVPTFNHKVYVIKYNLGEVKIESSQCDIVPGGCRSKGCHGYLLGSLAAPFGFTRHLIPTPICCCRLV